MHRILEAQISATMLSVFRKDWMDWFHWMFLDVGVFRRVGLVWFFLDKDFVVADI